MRLHRIVVFPRHFIGGVERDRGSCHRFVGVAARPVGRHAPACIGDNALRLRIRRIDEQRPRLIGHAERCGGALGVIERVGNDERNRLAIKAHGIVLQHVQPLAGGGVDAGLVREIGQLLGVAVRDDGDDAGHALDLGSLKSRDAAKADS
ncbi:hypothetical protein D9M72_533620 [compost metagenome]